MKGCSESWLRWRAYIAFSLVVASYFILMSGCLGHPPRDCLRDMMLIAYGIAFHVMIERNFPEAE